MNLDAEQLDRYSRQIILDEVGPAGQGAIADGSVLVVGAGGLGSPAIQYLAAAGVGRLGIADGDVVERSNLQRQIVHGADDVGRSKTDSAAEYVADQNPNVDVETYGDVGQSNAADLVADYDVVVDASDNFPTRFVLNDACVLEGTPLTHGAVYRFEGQTTTFSGGEPCYRCLFPEAPPEGTVPDCAEAGVFGAVTGTVGSVQATEALKLLMDVGDTLEGRLLVYDAKHLTTDFVPVTANPDCPVCGSDPIDSLSGGSYTGRCSVSD